MTDKLMRWEILEEWIFRTRENGGTFIHSEVMEALGLSNITATRYIQAYLDAQRLPDSNTLYVIHREGRTSSSVWHVGVRTKDARALSHQYFDDTKHRWKRAIEPDLNHLAERNPRAAPATERISEAVGHHAMEILRLAVGGFGGDDDDDHGSNGSPVK